MDNLIKKYCEFAKIDKDAELEFINAYNKFAKSSNFNKLDNLITKYQSDVTLCKEVISEIKALFIEVSVHEYTANAVSYILLIPSLKKEYLKRNIPNYLFENSIKDISYHVLYCKKIKGVWGTFTNWHEKFFSLKGFGFGRLQIIPSYAYADFNSDKISLKKGEPMLDVHIPNTGTPLTVEECELCYKLSAEYFKAHFNGKPIVFHCSSWLLWEKHFEILKPTSNICKFISKYTLVEKGLFNDYSQLWRIFEVDYNGNLDDLPVSSSLQKAYFDIVKRNEKVGYGTGLFIYR